MISRMQINENDYDFHTIANMRFKIYRKKLTYEDLTQNLEIAISHFGYAMNYMFSAYSESRFKCFDLHIDSKIILQSQFKDKSEIK